MKIIEWIYVTARDIGNLKKGINDSILEGYQPFGSVIPLWCPEDAKSYLNQPMVKYEPEKSKCEHLMGVFIDSDNPHTLIAKCIECGESPETVCNHIFETASDSSGNVSGSFFGRCKKCGFIR